MILKYRDILSAQIQPNVAKLIGQTNGRWPKTYCKSKWNSLQWPGQSPDLNPIEHAFHLLKTKLNAERPTNKQQLKSAAVKAWQSITKEENQSLVMSMTFFSRLKAVIACKGFSTNIKSEHFIYDYIYLSNYIWAPENGGTVYKNGCNS